MASSTGAGGGAGATAGAGAGSGSGASGQTPSQPLLSGPSKGGTYARLGPYTTKDGEVVPDIFIKDDVIVFFGMTITCRMVVVRLKNSRLLVYSPTNLDAQLVKDVNVLGTVGYILSPNKIHNMSMPQWKEKFPEARMYASPGLVERRQDLKFDATLKEEAEAEWADDFEQCLTEGNHFFAEVQLFHKASKTLLTCDMVENAGNANFGCCMGCLLSCCIAGPLGRFRNWASPEHRWYTDSRAGVRKTRHKVLAWDFDKVIMSHGAIIEEHAKDAVEELFENWEHECKCCCTCCCRCIASYQ